MSWARGISGGELRVDPFATGRLRRPRTLGRPPTRSRGSTIPRATEKGASHKDASRRCRDGVASEGSPRGTYAPRRLISPVRGGGLAHPPSPPGSWRARRCSVVAIAFGKSTLTSGRNGPITAYPMRYPRVLDLIPCSGWMIPWAGHVGPLEREPQERVLGLPLHPGPTWFDRARSCRSRRRDVDEGHRRSEACQRLGHREREVERRAAVVRFRHPRGRHAETEEAPSYPRTRSATTRGG